MPSRRNFIQQSALTGMVLSVPKGLSFLIKKNRFFSYESDYLKKIYAKS